MCIIEMFSGFQFEWAWQHPEKSRRLKHIPSRQKKERGYKYRFRIAAEMLQVGPWNRLPLTIRWLNQDYCLDFPAHLAPPTHMPVVYGPLKTKKVQPYACIKKYIDSFVDCCKKVTW